MTILPLSLTQIIQADLTPLQWTAMVTVETLSSVEIFMPQ